MDINPIQEKTNFIDKLIKYIKSLCKKKPDYEKIIQTSREAARKNYEAYRKFGTSCQSAAAAMEQMGTAIAKFDEVLPKNEIRKRLNMDTVTLYADDKAYCIINEKGDPIWLEKTK